MNPSFATLAVVLILASLAPSQGPAGARAADLKKEALYGTWEHRHAPTGLVLAFTCNPDGTGTMDEEPMRWSVAGDAFVVVQEGVAIRYAIRLDGDRLHASGGDLDEPMTFTRKGGKPAGGEKQPDGQHQQQPADGIGGAVGPQSPAPAGPRGSGMWILQVNGATHTLDLRPDGSGAFNGQPLKWTLAESSLKLEMNGGVVSYTAALAGDGLSLSGADLPQAVTFRRGGGAAAGTAAPRPAAPSVVGRWDSEDGPVELKVDGTGSLAGQPFRYVLEGNVIVVTGADGVVRIPFALDAAGNRMTVTVEGEQGVLTRVGAPPVNDQAGGAAGAPAGGMAGAGVYVAQEASVDPTNVMTYTQYIILWPDGTVGYAKAEGGATRSQVNEHLERFTSYRTNPQAKGQTVGRWEADGANVVVRWNLWDNLVCRGRVEGGVLRLEKMGVLSEGATLEFGKQ